MNNHTSDKPICLYKYRDDSERTEDIFKTQKVWLSSPTQLNDPLECRIGEIPKEWETSTIRKMEEAQILGILGLPFRDAPKTLFSLNEKETKKWFKRYKTISHKQRLTALRHLYSFHGMELSKPQNIFIDMRQRLLSIGIFSLSENCDSELMWAHYGSNHQGLAIGFNSTSERKLSNPRHTVQVTYSANKPTFTSGFNQELQIFAPGSGIPNKTRVSFEDKVFRSSISTKTLAWQYEAEWRYIEESHGSFDIPGQIATIIFGLRMKSERREHYIKLVNEYVKNDVRFYEVVEQLSYGGLEIKPA